MIDDPDIEYEDNPEYDEEGNPIWYMTELDDIDEFTPYQFNNGPQDVPEGYYNTVWSNSTSAVSLSDTDTNGEELTNSVDVILENTNTNYSDEQGQLNSAEKAYSLAADKIVEILTNVLQKGEITSEDNADLLDAQRELSIYDTLIKDICNKQQNDSDERELKQIKDNVVPTSIDDIISLLTEGGTKPWLYKDENNNVLMDGTAIPELTVLAKKLNLIVTNGDNESEFQLSPEFMKLISDKIILDASKIELKGSININEGLFKVLPSGRTQIGGLTGHIIDDVERAQLEINTKGTLYSVSKTTANLYAKLSEGYIQFVNGNQVSKITSAGIDTTSDIRLKENILPIDGRYEKLMLDISPISFNMKDDRENIPKRRNIGFSAQQVESLMSDYGIDYNEFAALNKNEAGIYSLNYNEFIALNTHMIQTLYKKIIELQKRIEELEKK